MTGRSRSGVGFPARVAAQAQQPRPRPAHTRLGREREAALDRRERLVPSADGKFDPNFHQAVSTKATNEVEENTVIEEMRKGYTLNGRLLRPAMVSVSTKE